MINKYSNEDLEAERDSQLEQIDKSPLRESIEKDTQKNIMETLHGQMENMEENQEKVAEINEGTTSNNQTHENVQTDFESWEEISNVLEKENYKLVWGEAIIAWKYVIVAEKDWKQFIMWWKEKYSDDFDYVKAPRDVSWKPTFAAYKNWKNFIMWWKEKYSDDFDNIWNPTDISWKPAFTAYKNWKWFIMLWKEKYSDDFDDIWGPVNILMISTI